MDDIRIYRNRNPGVPEYSFALITNTDTDGPGWSEIENYFAPPPLNLYSLLQCYRGFRRYRGRPLYNIMHPV